MCVLCCVNIIYNILVLPTWRENINLLWFCIGIKDDELRDICLFFILKPLIRSPEYMFNEI